MRKSLTQALIFPYSSNLFSKIVSIVILYNNQRLPLVLYQNKFPLPLKFKSGRSTLRHHASFAAATMHHLIIGYGYAGFHLAKYLISKKESVTAVSRHLDDSQNVPGVNYIQHDIQTPLVWSKQDTILYYLIPPPATGQHDTLLQAFINVSPIKPAKVIYFGSSGVYGDKSGDWVDEESPCSISFDRQNRRLDAEKQCMQFSIENNIDCVLLRIAGIYGPGRLPIDAARKQATLIDPQFAPATNLIYVKDLAQIAASLAMSNHAQGIYNVADGLPEPMGSLQQHVAKLLGIASAPFQSFQEAWADASAMKREFMQASKCLSIKALQMTLTDSLAITPKEIAISESLHEEGIRS